MENLKRFSSLSSSFLGCGGLRCSVEVARYQRFLFRPASSRLKDLGGGFVAPWLLGGQTGWGSVFCLWLFPVLSSFFFFLVLSRS